ncbi:MAG: succinate dehydrogenase cytochrome b subunit [Candidatus Neomarinimicrobiota bacterium]
MNKYITSTIFKKTVAAFSGLFLTLFLLGHLAGNLQLFIPGIEGQTLFNKYALFMTTNPAVKILSIVTYISILLHIFLTLYLVLQSKRARPIGYSVSSGTLNSTWSSNNMGILGIFLLFFIVIHMKSFWYEMHFGEMPYQYLDDGTKIKDLYLITTSAFNNILYTLFYVLSMIALALHLKHGVESAVQTIGLKFPNYEKPLKYLSGFIALIIPATFASIPIYLYFKGL